MKSIESVLLGSELALLNKLLGKEKKGLTIEQRIEFFLEKTGYNRVFMLSLNAEELANLENGDVLEIQASQNTKTKNIFFISKYGFKYAVQFIYAGNNMSITICHAVTKKEAEYDDDFDAKFNERLKELNIKMPKDKSNQYEDLRLQI